MYLEVFSIGRIFEHSSNAITGSANSLRMEGVEDAHILTPLSIVLLLFSSSNILECNCELWKLQRNDEFLLKVITLFMSQEF